MRPFPVVILTLVSLAVLIGIGYAVLSARAEADWRKQEEDEASLRADYGDDIIID